MSIHKPRDYIEVYRLKARDGDPHEMSGRTGRPELTRFVNERIVARLQPAPHDSVVDVGCGDGSLLRAIRDARGQDAGGALLGVLPSAEEVARLRSELPATLAIRVEQGLATQVPLPDASADKVILNGVLLLLPDAAAVQACLAELARVCRPGGQVYVGEVPDRNEFADRPYGDSIVAWLWWLLRKRGPAAVWPRFKQVLRARLGRETFVILPKRLFFIAPEAFLLLLRQNGFHDIVVEKHMELDHSGVAVASATRWNYLARKT